MSALENASKAISAELPLPILAGVKLCANGSMTLTGTDLEIGIENIVQTEIIEPGTLVIPAGRMVKVFQKLPHGSFTLESDGFSALIRAGRSETVINGFNPDEYPELPQTETKVSFEISGEVLSDSLARVVYAAAKDDSRPVFTGVLFEIKGPEMTLVATDTHRLAQVPAGLPSAPGDKSIIVPGKTAMEVTKLFKGSDKITLVIGDNNVTFKTEKISVISRLLSGSFPNYKAVIPTEFRTRVKINGKALRESVERASILSAGSTPIVGLEIQNDKVVVSLSSESGKAREEIPCITEGNNLEIHFKAGYLSEALKNTPGEEVRISFNGPLDPTMITPVNGSRGLTIVLPVRV